MQHPHLFKVLAFYESLRKHSEKFNLFICCMDQLTFTFLKNKNIKNIILIPVKSFENPTLKKIKKERKINEYCWTLKPYLCSYILLNYGEVDHIIYCDADKFFFSDPTALLDEWGLYSIFLCRQRGTPELEHKFGMYQAGLIGFKREKNSLDILSWWKMKCLENCSKTYDAYYNSWGDQKYLDGIPLLFGNIKIIDNIGINVAPWNLVMNNDHAISEKTHKFI